MLVKVRHGNVLIVRIYSIIVKSCRHRRLSSFDLKLSYEAYRERPRLCGVCHLWQQTLAEDCCRHLRRDVA